MRITILFLNLMMGVSYTQVLFAQTYAVIELQEGQKTSLRGLSVVSDKIIWVSGSKGTIGKSINGGISWEWMQVPNNTERDFRDIEAFDENTAIIMGIAAPAIILKTTNGGKSWNTVLIDSTKGMFLDAMHFVDNLNGIVIGDPIADFPYLAITKNGGNSWEKLPNENNNKVLEGEAFFASSGSNIQLLNNNFYKPAYAYISGGKNSRLNINHHFFDFPIIKGKESTGANSIAFNSLKNKGIIIGGDFANDTITSNNCYLFTIHNGAVEFKAPKTPPFGYKSCVIYANNNHLIACGTSGTDISLDGGMNWQHIHSKSYHVVQKAKMGNAIFLAGGMGKIARVEVVQ